MLGCGWLGYPLAQQLIRDGYQVRGSTTSMEKMSLLQSAGIEPYHLTIGERIEGTIGDFFDSDLLILNIPPGRRRPDVADRYPQEIRLIMEQAIAAGIPRLIFASSTGVYPDTNRLMTEEDVVGGVTGSGLALVRSENYLRQLNDLQLTILRFSGLVGGSRKAGRFLAGKSNVPNGDAPVNMVHLEDCIAVIISIIGQEVWNETFNVCADEHPSKRDFYTRQALKDGFEPPTFADDNELPAYKTIANRKLKERLHYQFLHPDPLDF